MRVDLGMRGAAADVRIPLRLLAAAASHFGGQGERT